MKKSDPRPVKETPEQELKRLRKENARLKRQFEKRKEDDKAKLKEIRKELSEERKKKDVRKMRLSEEQWRSLSSLFPDIDSLFR